MKEISYQKIYEVLEELLPEKWSRLIYVAEYFSGSYSMKFYVDKGDRKFTDCFLLDIPQKDIIAAFLRLDKIISPVRKQLTYKDKWTVVTLIISADGKFKADFDYEDISERTMDYERDWKKKYLK